MVRILFFAVSLTFAFQTVAVAEPAAAPRRQAAPAEGGSRGILRWLESIPKPEHYRLENGLKVVLQPMSGRGRVTVLVSYNIGAGDDPPELDGLAHLIEHMTFRGSRHLADLELFALLEGNGIDDYNGQTTPEVTRYFATVPTSKLPLALWLESERMAFTLESFTQNVLNVERSVIKNELLSWRRESQRPMRHALGRMFGEGHPYAPPAQMTQDLDKIQLEHVQSVFQAGYRPDNATLVLAGDFRPRAAKRLITKYFGAIVGGGAAFESRPVPAPQGLSTLREITVRDRIFEQELHRKWLTPSAGARENMLARVVLTQLGSQLKARFRKESVDVDVNVVMYEAGPWAIGGIRIKLPEQMTLKGVEPEEFESEFEEEFARLPQSDWSSVLAGAKRQQLLSNVRALENPRNWAIRIERTLRHSGQPFDLQEHLADFLSVTPAEIDVYRRKYFSDPGLTLRLKKAELGRQIGPNGSVEVVRRVQ